MKQATLLCTILLFPVMLLSQKSINLAGLKFQQYDKGGASTFLQFSSNTQATYIISGTSPIGGKTYRDECPCKCTVTGTSIEIVCNCADKDIYPDPIKDSFTYDAASKTLKSSRYSYTSGSAPESSLAGKNILWKQK